MMQAMVTIARWECVSPVEPPFGSTTMYRCLGRMLPIRLASGGRFANDSTTSPLNTAFCPVTAMPSDSRCRVSSRSTQ